MSWFWTTVTHYQDLGLRFSSFKSERKQMGFPSSQCKLIQLASVNFKFGPYAFWLVKIEQIREADSRPELVDKIDLFGMH